jgi:type IV fimbrial biogenesis protein FimT
MELAQPKGCLQWTVNERAVVSSRLRHLHRIAVGDIQMNISGHSKNSGTQAQRGLTIVEILIAISVLSVIFLVGTPGVSYLTQQYHLKNTSDDLMAAVSMAQIEAANRYSTVRICPSSEGAVCREDGDWNRGWLVFTDGNNNQVPDRIEILEYYSPPNKNVRIQASGAVEETASFNLSGLISHNGSAVGSFTVCPTGTISGSSTISMDADGLLGFEKSDSSCNLR